MGPMALLPFRRKSYSGFLRSEKIHRPRPGLNPRTSDPVASMVTTGPPRLTEFARQRTISNKTPMVNILELLPKVVPYRSHEKLYKLDRMANELSNDIISLPPYLCQYNPIQLIWANIKQQVPDCNSSFRL